VTIASLRDGGRRVVFTTALGGQIGLDVTAERAAEIARELTATPEPVSSEASA
jgi:hypothetical protein